MNKRFRGSITVESSLVFSMILIIILMLCILSLYLSDVVSIRAYLQTYVCIEAKGNKSVDVMENEIKNELKNYTYITDITNVNIKKMDDILKLKVDYNLENKIMDIKLNNNIEVTGYIENNREYLVRAKVFIDSIKDFGGINIWIRFIRKMQIIII